MYRGASGKLQGIYLFGDFCSGRVWGLRRTAKGFWENSVLTDSTVSVVSFGEDEAGELYVADYFGDVYKLSTTQPRRR